MTTTRKESSGYDEDTIKARDRAAGPESETPRVTKLVLSFPSLPYDQQQSKRYGRMIQLACQLERELSQAQADLERECSDGDRICTKLGLNGDQFRTDGGSLHVPRILQHIQETLDTLTQAAQFGATMSDKYGHCQADLKATDEKLDEAQKEVEHYRDVWLSERKAREDAERTVGHISRACDKHYECAEAAESRLAELQKHAEAMARSLEVYEGAWPLKGSAKSSYEQWKESGR